VPMKEGNRNNGEPPNHQGIVLMVNLAVYGFYLGLSPTFCHWHKDIGKPLVYILQSPLVPVDRKPLTLGFRINPHLSCRRRGMGSSVGKDANVIQAVEMIGMTMSQKKGIKAIYTRF